MANQTGILTAIMHNLQVMPRVINVFDDLKTGKNAASMKISAKDPSQAKRSLARLIYSTVENNRIGTLSDYVPVEWAKIHATIQESQDTLELEKEVEMTKNIRKCDTQVNDSIDFAKKQPDEEIHWMKTKKNKLESEAHKHAGKATKDRAKDGKPIFEAEMPTTEGEDDGGIVGAIHEELKDIPETKNLKSIGRSEHGHNIWRVEETHKFDITKMEIARWKDTESIETQLTKDFKERIELIANKAHKRGSEKLAKKIRNIEKKIIEKHKEKTIDAFEMIGWLEDVVEVATEEGYATTQAYNLIGLAIAGNEEKAEKAWKSMSNIRLSYIRNRMNDIDGKADKRNDDISMSDRMRPIKKTIRVWAKSWALAKAENTNTSTQEAEKVEKELHEELKKEEEIMPDEDFF